MNALGLLTIATLGTLAYAARHLMLDLARERRRNARLHARIEDLLDELDDASMLLAVQAAEEAQRRHPAGRGAHLAIIDGGA